MDELDVQKELNSMRGNPVLWTAFTVASQAHGLTRRKYPRPGHKLPPLYIEHLQRVYSILRQNDEIQGKQQDDTMLAAALLHDVIEDTEYDSKEKLKQRLLNVMVDPAFQHVPDKQMQVVPSPLTERQAEEISQVVQEVTNAKTMPKSKRLFQVEHMRNASERAKKIKIADQLSYLIDTYEQPSDRIEFPQINKCLDVFKACRGVDALLEECFRAVYGKVRKALHEKTIDRESLVFDINTMLRTGLKRLEKNAPKTIKSEQQTIRNFVSVKRPDATEGVVEVGTNQNNHVTSFALVFNSTEDQKNPCNEIGMEIINKLETYPRRRVTTGIEKLRGENGLVVQEFTLKDPLPPKSFMRGLMTYIPHDMRIHLRALEKEKKLSRAA